MKRSKPAANLQPPASTASNRLVGERGHDHANAGPGGALIGSATEQPAPNVSEKTLAGRRRHSRLLGPSTASECERRASS